MKGKHSMEFSIRFHIDPIHLNTVFLAGTGIQAILQATDLFIAHSPFRPLHQVIGISFVFPIDGKRF